MKRRQAMGWYWGQTPRSFVPEPPKWQIPSFKWWHIFFFSSVGRRGGWLKGGVGGEGSVAPDSAILCVWVGWVGGAGRMFWMNWPIWAEGVTGMGGETGGVRVGGVSGSMGGAEYWGGGGLGGVVASGGNSGLGRRGRADREGSGSLL